MKKYANARMSQQSEKRSLPKGWDEKRVKEVIAHYERQTEDQELVEYEAAMKVDGQSVMVVPTALVPEIRRLIARRRGA